MTTPHSSSSQTSDGATVTASPPPPAIPISAHHHLPIKLTPANFSSWRTHLTALLNGFNLIGHINGDTPRPDATTDVAASARWFQQDQLLLAAILGSVSAEILPLLSSATTSAAAWSTLTRAFASTSRAHVVHLKTTLTKASIGSRTITEYVNHIKAIADEFGLIDAPITDDDLTIYIINGLEPAYRDIVSAVRTRETSFRFEELRDRLIEHELYLKHLDTENSNFVVTANNAQSQQRSSSTKNNSRGQSSSYSSNRGRGGGQGRGWGGGRGSNNGANKNPVICQLCGFTGHSAPSCRRLPAMANVAQSQSQPTPPQAWLMDSGASYNLTNELSNLSNHSEYDGTDEIQIADGTGLPITHTGISTIHTPSHKFKLSNVLCVPGAAKNLIFVHQFTKANNVSLEFFPDYFLVKDLTTGRI